MTDNAVVHLIDDDDAVRQALAFLLAASGFAVRSYPSAVAFLEVVSTLPPGCIVTDIRMPGIDGLELQHRLNALQLTLPVVVMTGHGDIPLAVAAMKAGAVDFLEKPFDDEALISAVRTAIGRQTSHASHLVEIAAIQEKLATLSPRETEILDGLLAGHSNKIIAGDLKISFRTVEVHRANLMIKMGASSLSLLVQMVVRARSGIQG